VNGPEDRRSAPGVHRVDETEQNGGVPAARRLGWRLMGRPAIAYRGTSGRAELALTFDDGPSRWTEEIAATLEEHGCRATFFIRGAAIEERPQNLAALAQAGHELGNHLWSHTDATNQSRAEIRAEIKRTATAIRAVTGRRPRLVRSPYCKAPQAVADAARWTGVRVIVQRSIGSEDWRASAPEEVSEPVLEGAEPGDIVCLHDGVSPNRRDSASREVTAAAVKRLVPGLLERGLRPVTVSRLLA
jgi:peptidoglycan-N-acetylglucosamine deacetylase